MTSIWFYYVNIDWCGQDGGLNVEATLFTVAMLVCETEHAHVFAGKCVSDTLQKDFVNAQRCDCFLPHNILWSFQIVSMFIVACSL